MLLFSLPFLLLFLPLPQFQLLFPMCFLLALVDRAVALLPLQALRLELRRWRLLQLWCCWWWLSSLSSSFRHYFCQLSCGHPFELPIIVDISVVYCHGGGGGGGRGDRPHGLIVFSDAFPPCAQEGSISADQNLGFSEETLSGS